MDGVETDRPLRVAVLFSGSASGFRYLADRDPSFNDAYEVVGGIASSSESDGISAFEHRGIPVKVNDITSFYAEREAELSDLSIRESFDHRTAELLESLSPDVVLLSGYMWILTAPVFTRYHTINVHPADLTITTADGTRKYVGYEPVKDAIVAGEPETRSTVHFVTQDVDEGPLLVRSKAFPVHEPLVECLIENRQESSVAEYASAHQEWMKWDGDGPAIAKGLALLANGRVDRDGTTVRIDGTPGFYDLGSNAVHPV